MHNTTHTKNTIPLSPRRFNELRLCAVELNIEKQNINNKALIAAH